MSPNATDDFITILGARVHNLQGISCKIPRNKLVVVTGPSGSGKTSLVFDTLFREAQYRFLSPLLLGKKSSTHKFERARVDAITGLSFTIAAKAKRLSSRFATLATLTETYENLRLLFFHLGTPHCIHCGNAIKVSTQRQIVSKLLAYPQNSRLVICTPLFQKTRKELEALCTSFLAQGYTRARFQGRYFRLEEMPLYLKEVDWRKKDVQFAVVIDIFRLLRENELRLLEAVELALSLADGNILIAVSDRDPQDTQGAQNKEEELLMSTVLLCTHCGEIQEPIHPSQFSFYLSQKGCPVCFGCGSVENRAKQETNVQPETPCPDDETIPWEEAQTCHACQGTRLEKPPASLKLGGVSLGALLKGSVADAHRWCKSLAILQKRSDENILADDSSEGKREVGNKFNKKDWQRQKANILLRQCKDDLLRRLSSLLQLGLGYLELYRSAHSLSSGEVQRAGLARFLSSDMKGVLYLVDEPLGGLHPREKKRLLESLLIFVKEGNSVIAIEHDLMILRAADWIIELGPHSGSRGGKLIASGSREDAIQKETPAGSLLQGKPSFQRPAQEIKGKQATDSLTLLGITKHNLKNITVSFPLHSFVVITGVSGSGKSSLIGHCLVPVLQKILSLKKRRVQDARQYKNKAVAIVAEEYRLPEKILKHYALKEIRGWESLLRVVDATTISRAHGNLSIVATAANLLSPLRNLFSLTQEAKLHGYTSRHFTFNDPLGACGQCHGQGYATLKVSPFPSVMVTCSVCQGRRYKAEIEEVKYRRLSIREVLDLTIEECASLLSNIAPMRHILNRLAEVGLGYVRLSQRTSTLSAGEQQRLKLIRDLGQKKGGRTLYVFDEPSRGLSQYEVPSLIQLLRRLVSEGNTVIAIEHNLEIIQHADYNIELGPEAGRAGGEVVATTSRYV